MAMTERNFKVPYGGKHIMTKISKITMTTFVFALLSFAWAEPAQSYCVQNESGHKINVSDFAVPNKKSLDNGDLKPGEAGCKPGQMLPIQYDKPLKRGVVSINDKDSGVTVDCEVSPDGVIRYDGKHCYSRRAGYDFMNRNPSVEYNMN